MQPHKIKKGSGRKLVIIFTIVICIGVIGMALRLHTAHALRDDAKKNSTVTVSVINPVKGESIEEVVLPGNVQPWHETIIYARTNGYVKQWYTPMGTAVKAGDVLAEIETPEIDAQLRQAEADLKTAQANYKLAQSTAERWNALRKTDAVSKQEADEKTGDALAKEAAMDSARANRDHLKELSSFKKVVAPFDGVIASRTLDIGMLVNSGGGPDQQPLFRLVQSNPLRVYVRVPQSDAGRINPNVVAELHFTDRPGEVVQAQFLKTAESLDAASRSLLTEFIVDNKDGKFFSGGYAEVHIKLPSISTNLRLPVNALIFRAEGLQVATVDQNNHVAIKSITMGRDFGNQVEISAGLEETDRVIINPPDSLLKDQEVHVATPAEEKKAEDKKHNGKDPKKAKEEKKDAEKQEKKEEKAPKDGRPQDDKK